MLGLIALLDENWPVDARKESVRRLAEQSADGNLEATKILFNYAFGKPKELKEHSGSVSVTVVYEDQPLGGKV